MSFGHGMNGGGGGTTGGGITHEAGCNGGEVGGGTMRQNKSNVVVVNGVIQSIPELGWEDV